MSGARGLEEDVFGRQREHRAPPPALCTHTTGLSAADNRGVFEAYLERWQLLPDGPPIVTACSRLLPVRRSGEPAMLKIAGEAEEKLGGLLMTYWDGEGAARVLACEGDALLLERADDNGKLADMAKSGRDDEASRVLCGVAAKLHAPRGPLPPGLFPLSEWFQDLWPAAAEYGGVLAGSAAAARELLAAPQDVTTLHGDLHHGNVLEFGARGWLAIDPKRLVGERGFDFANIFCNPDLETATAPGRLTRQSYIVAETAGLDRQRLLKWILAYAGLSAAWWLGDGVEPALDFVVAKQALAELAI